MKAETYKKLIVEEDTIVVDRNPERELRDDLKKHYKDQFQGHLIFGLVLGVIFLVTLLGITPGMT